MGPRRWDRRHRLTSSQEFKRVRHAGRTYAHPLAILMASRNDLGRTRIGVRAGRAVGGAVVRNRARRRLRAAWRLTAAQVARGWDVVLEARRGTPTADWSDLHRAVFDLCRRAGLLEGTS